MSTNTDLSSYGPGFSDADLSSYGPELTDADLESFAGGMLMSDPTRADRNWIPQEGGEFVGFPA